MPNGIHHTQTGVCSGVSSSHFIGDLDDDGTSGDQYEKDDFWSTEPVQANGIGTKVMHDIWNDDAFTTDFEGEDPEAQSVPQYLRQGGPSGATGSGPPDGGFWNAPPVFSSGNPSHFITNDHSDNDHVSDVTVAVDDQEEALRKTNVPIRSPTRRPSRRRLTRNNVAGASLYGTGVASQTCCSRSPQRRG